MKKMWIFLLSCGMILAVAKPVAAGSSNFWPGFAAGVGTAIVVGAILAAPRIAWADPPCAPPPPRAVYPAVPYGNRPYYRAHQSPGYWRVVHDPYRGKKRVWVPGCGQGVPEATE